MHSRQYRLRWKHTFPGPHSHSSVALGLIGSLAATRLMSTLLFDVKAGDPTTFAMVCASLLAVGIAAGLVPALRAMSVDPVRTLKNESHDCFCISCRCRNAV